MVTNGNLLMFKKFKILAALKLPSATTRHYLFRIYINSNYFPDGHTAALLDIKLIV